MTLQSSDVAPFEVDSIEKLAEALKLSPSKLKNAVDEFNAACNEKQFNLMALDGKATVRLNPNKTN
jgi:predicted metal-dependent phosphoesterase TrpH